MDGQAYSILDDIVGLQRSMTLLLEFSMALSCLFTSLVEALDISFTTLGMDH